MKSFKILFTSILLWQDMQQCVRIGRLCLAGRWFNKCLNWWGRTGREMEGLHSREKRYILRDTKYAKTFMVNCREILLYCLLWLYHVCTEEVDYFEMVPLFFSSLCFVAQSQTNTYTFQHVVISVLLVLTVL